MTSALETIHNRTMDLLAQTGFEIEHPLIEKALVKEGVKVAGGVAYFDEASLMRLIDRAPRQFNLYARNPQFHITIDGSETHFAPAYGCTYIIDAEGNRRAALFEDYLIFSKLVQQSPHFKINGGIMVQPGDITAENSSLAMLYATLLNSDKCILGIAGTEKEMEKNLSLCAIAFGGPGYFAKKPHMLTLLNTFSPLRLGLHGCGTIIVSARYKQPIVVSPGPMSGATGPLTAAGNLIIGNAEALAAIAAIQAYAPGLPVFYGVHPTAMDMATGGISIGSPHCIKQMEYSSMLAGFYGLPGRCGGSLTDAKRVGARSGSESMAALMTAKKYNNSLVIHSAGVLDGYSAVSYEKFIADLQNMDYLARLDAPLDISEEHLAFDIITGAGIGGEYLTSPHTLHHCREGVYRELTVASLLQGYVQPEMDQDIRSALDRYLLEQAGAAEGQLILDALKEASPHNCAGG